MAKKSIAERIAQLEAQKKTLQARLGKQGRAKDTRRKVLLGAFLLHRLENDRAFGPTLRDYVKRELPGFISREADKAMLVDLLGDANSFPPIPPNGAPSAVAASLQDFAPQRKQAPTPVSDPYSSFQIRPDRLEI